MAITLEAIRAAGGIVHSDGNIFFRDISMLEALAGAAPAAVAPQGERQWICPTRTVADLVNNLLMMEPALPIYGAQYVEIEGRRRAVAVPPTVSRERVKDGRWIGQGEDLNAAVVWTRAEQPAGVAGPAWDKTRDSLATLLLGLAHRPFLDFDVACIALDAATEPGMPLAYMRGATAAPALEAPAAPVGSARQFIEWMYSQPEDREPTTAEGALLEFEAHIAAAAPQAPAKGLPYEPTSDMIIAGRACDPALPLDTVRAIWWAMWRTAPQAPAAPVVDDDGHLSDELRELITGMTVSVDVSTGEHDAGNRLFGEVTEVMEYDQGSDKHGVVLLVQSPESNFKAAPAAPVGEYTLVDEGGPVELAGAQAQYSIERADGSTAAWILGDGSAVAELMAALRMPVSGPCAAAPAAPAVDAQGERDAAFEAVRQRLCSLQRYSFVLDDDGVVRRAQDRTGSWIEFDDAHALFDPEAVDAAIAAQAKEGGDA